MRPPILGGGTTAGSNAVCFLADRRFSNGGGGCQAANAWYPRRLNTTILNDLSFYLEIVSYPVASFVAGTPGSLTITGDVTAQMLVGRMCDIRNPGVANNDSTASVRPFIVETSAEVAGVTTLEFYANAAFYRYGDIVADVGGDSTLYTTMFKCLESGDYVISARANSFGLQQTVLRLVNVSGFTYGQYGAVTGEGGTVFPVGFYSYWNTIPGPTEYTQVVSLVAGNYYELQQWSDDAQAADDGFGYDIANIPSAFNYAELMIWRYNP